MIPEGLESLRDIHPPADPQLWPPAIGWWFIVLIVVLFLIYQPRLTRFARRRSLRRESLKKLADLKTRANDQADDGVFAELSQLLRQVALRRFPEEQCAGLSGVTWLAFLRRTDESEAMDSPLAERLLDAPYRRQPEVSAEELVKLGGEWIEQHA